MSTVNAAEATEFSRRRSLPYVEVRYMFTKRGSTIALSLCGQDLGSKTEFTKRGKVVSTLFVLPKIG